MIKAILFDSDGVLVDTEQMFFDATRAVFESVGVVLSPAQWARWYLGEGRSSREIAKLLGISPSSIDDIIPKRNEMFWQSIDQGVPVFPGVKETLRHLADHFRLAIVTGASREHFERVHLSTGLAVFFECVITSDQYEIAKPSPQAYLTALQTLSLNPHECLAVEDSPRGAQAAVSAGIRCFIIPTDLTATALCPASCEILSDIAQLVERIR